MSDKRYQTYVKREIVQTFINQLNRLFDQIHKDHLHTYCENQTVYVGGKIYDLINLFDFSQHEDLFLTRSQLIEKASHIVNVYGVVREFRPTPESEYTFCSYMRIVLSGQEEELSVFPCIYKNQLRFLKIEFENSLIIAFMICYTNDSIYNTDF